MEASSLVELACDDARAAVLPTVGANVVRWTVGSWSILAEPPDVATIEHAPARWGIPILFPFPNRIRDARYVFRGREHTWSPRDAQGNARHGFALREPWEVVSRGASEVVLRLDVGARQDLLAVYPFPCVVTYSVRLARRTLTTEITVASTGPIEMPIGFGLHPYVALPLGPGGSRADTRIQVPARSTWELDHGLPTGERTEVKGRLDLRAGRPLGADTYDDLFGDLEGDEAAVICGARGREVAIAAARADGFHDWCVYAPAGRDVVALEPYTCPTDAFNLAARGFDAPFTILPPGESWSTRVVFRAHDPDRA
jgi:aldose 1-epimerase